MRPITIHFKPGCDDAAQECLDKLDRVEAQTKAKGEPGPCVLSTGIDNGGRTIVVVFADALDQLAFMCAIGAATYEIKESTPNPVKGLNMSVFPIKKEP